MMGGHNTEYKSKSEQIRALSDEGIPIAVIAKRMNTYYSFVHRVVKRHEQQQLNDSPSLIHIHSVEELFRQGCSVDEVLKKLNLPENHRTRIYKQYKQFKHNNK